MVTDLIENTRRRIEQAGAKSLADVRRHPERLAAFSPQVEAQRRQCKEFLYANVYDSVALKPEKDKGERLITELFEHFIAHPETLPASYQELARTHALPRVVCDYVAGMTDNYIFDQHAKLVGGRRSGAR
jgi:dGTPase